MILLIPSAPFTAPPPLPSLPISQANILATSYEQAATATSTSTTSPARRTLRPYASSSSAPPFSPPWGEAQPSSSLSPVLQRTTGGMKSLSGKRSLGAGSSSSPTTPASAAPASHRRERSQHHVHFKFPPSIAPPPTAHSSISRAASTSLPNLSSLHPPSPNTKQKEGPETMLLGPNASEVSRAWREEKERKRKEMDAKRIKELEEEVRKLRGEVSFSCSC